MKFDTQEKILEIIKKLRVKGKTIQEIADICQTTWFNVQRWLKGRPMSALSIRVIGRIFEDMTDKKEDK